MQISRIRRYRVLHRRPTRGEAAARTGAPARDRRSACSSAAPGEDGRGADSVSRFAFWYSFCLKRETVSGTGRRSPHSGTRSGVRAGSAVVASWPSGSPSLLRRHAPGRAPLLDGRSPVSRLLWAQPTPADAAVPLWLRAPRWVPPTSTGLPDHCPTFRCALSPTTPAGPVAAHARCFTTGSRLHQLGEPGRLRLGVSRPNRVRLRYGSHLRWAESPAVGLLPPTAPPATCLTGHYTAASSHAARLARFTGGSQGAKNAMADGRMERNKRNF